MHRTSDSLAKILRKSWIDRESQKPLVCSSAEFSGSIYASKRLSDLEINIITSHGSSDNSPVHQKSSSDNTTLNTSEGLNYQFDGTSEGIYSFTTVSSVVPPHLEQKDCTQSTLECSDEEDQPP